MAGPRSHDLPSPGVGAGIVIAMRAMIVIPAAITLQTVHVPAPLTPVDPSSHAARLHSQPSALYRPHHRHRGMVPAE